MTDDEDDTPSISVTQMRQLCLRGATIEQLEQFAAEGILPPKYLYAQLPLIMAVPLRFEKHEPITRAAKAHCIWRTMQWTDGVPPYDWWVFRYRKGRRKLVLFFGFENRYDVELSSQRFRRQNIYPKVWTVEQQNSIIGGLLRDAKRQGKETTLKEGDKVIDWEHDPRFRPPQPSLRIVEQ
jgi:hypothetical protein